MKQDEELGPLIRKAALANAVKHDGKAEVGAVIGRVLAERPDLRRAVEELASLCTQTVKEINQLSVSDQRRAIEESWPELLRDEREAKEKRLPPLPNVEKYSQVVTRFAPNPDCVLHLGSTRAIILCHEYARMYNGKFILRLEDTDPRLKKPKLEFYDSIENDVLWLGCKWDQEVIQSDRLEAYYGCAKKLLEIGSAYVCTCELDTFRTLTLSSRPCPDRNLEPSKHLARWEKMLSGAYTEKEALVRVKTDLQHPNPAARDWPALRIIDTKRFPHPRVGSKYTVWPLYNLACGVDDHLLGISHIIRGKEHLTNEVRQRFMYTSLRWEYPETLHYGRLKVTDAELSKSKIVRLVQEKVVSGFDDPRLATLSALRRRGIKPETLREVVMEIGARPVDASLSWQNIYAINRKMIDDQANRFFFLRDPVRVVIYGVERTYVSTPPLHPDHPERGRRKLEVKPSDGEAVILIASNDAQTISEGKFIRLIELFNIQFTSANKDTIKAKFISESYEDARKTGAPLLQWLPLENNINAGLLMTNGEKVEGFGEIALSNVAVDEMVQLVRMGFGRMDNKSPERVEVVYAHK
ncbi:glutamate--tRNA ligase [Candidatus Bathyarchaeota archaeon]|nr:glutamate--tRNA ligase [Candidatus Bathyarchaeota archaeon]